jgi:hypothetical protein
MDPARRSTLSSASNTSLRGEFSFPSSSSSFSYTHTFRKRRESSTYPRVTTLSKWDDTLVVPPTPIQPFYKKRWFILSRIIIIPLGIALLFIILFPVVRAIVPLVVKRSELDVQVAVITQPQNTT